MTGSVPLALLVAVAAASPADAQPAERRRQVPLVAGDPAPAPSRGPATDGDALSVEQRGLVLEAVSAIRRGQGSRALDAIDRLEETLPLRHWLRPGLAELRAMAGVQREDSSAEAESVASLYVTTTGYGLYTGGWLFGALLELDGRAAFPLSVLTGGGGLLTAWLLDRSLELDGAAADAVSSGLLLGAIEGALLLPALNIDVDDDDAILTTSWALGIATGAVSGWLVRSRDVSRGDVAFVSASTLWGGGLTLGMAIALGAESSDRLAQAFVLGSLAGVGTGAYAAQSLEWSTSRVLWVNLGGLLGALAGGAIVVATGADEAEPIGLTLTASYAAGLGLAMWLTEPTAATEPSADEVAFHLAPTVLRAPDPMAPATPGMGLTLRW